MCAYDPWWLCVRQKTQRDASKESGTAGMLFYGLINNVDGSWVVNPNNKVRTQQGPLHFPKNQKLLFSYLLYKAALHISSTGAPFLGQRTGVEQLLEKRRSSQHAARSDDDSVSIFLCPSMPEALDIDPNPPIRSI